MGKWKVYASDFERASGISGMRKLFHELSKWSSTDPTAYAIRNDGATLTPSEDGWRFKGPKVVALGRKHKRSRRVRRGRR